jgi:hypothetical protein
MEMKFNNIAEVALGIVCIGAGEYLKTHNLRADADTLAVVCKQWAAIQLPVALKDAKDALDCGMTAIAEQTFKATMLQAGIEAAKEAGMPADKCAA